MATDMYGFRTPETKLTWEQLDLRKRVLKQIENEPDSFDMLHWEVIDGYSTERQVRVRTCGTTRCLAGWALHEAGQPVIHPDAHPDARAWSVLGLTYDEYRAEGNDGLFYLPEDYAALEAFRKITESPENPPWD